MDRLMKKLGLLALCTGLSLAVHAVTPQAEAPAEQNVKIDSVVVTGARYASDIRHLPMTVSVVGREKIEQSLQPSLLPTLTEQVPGLFTTARGIMGYGVSDGAAGGISLRGLSGGSGRLMVLIDGHPQYMGLMGHPIADAYQSLMAERVEVLRGPASVLYGSNAMGGVVNIVTRGMREDGVKTYADIGYGSYNTLQTEATNRIRKGRFTSVVSGSYNRTDGHRADMGFEQYGGYAKLGYEISQAWNVRADVNVTHFNASQPGTVTNPMADADQRITRGMTSLSVENNYGRTSGALSLFYNWGRHRINDGYTVDPNDTNNPKDYRFNSRDDMMGVSWYQSARLFRGNRLTVGADYYRFGGEAWNRYVGGDRKGERSDIADKSQDEVAGYVDFRQDIGGWLTFDAGLRVDHHSHIGTEWIPQAGLSFHLPHTIELKASASKGFRYPTIREMYMFPPQNPDLKPERMWNYEVAYSQRLLGGRLTYGINLFYIDGENLIVAVRQRRRRGTGRLPHFGGLVGRRQLQLPAHGEPRDRRTGAQALHRGRVCPGPLVGDYGRTVRRGALHFGKGQRPGHGEHRGFRAVEPAGVAAREPLPHAVRPGRKPAGAALRDKRRIPHAAGDLHRRHTPGFLNTGGKHYF